MSRDSKRRDPSRARNRHGDSMSIFSAPDLQERQNTAAAAKKALLEKFRSAANDPAAAQRREARQAILDARKVRMAEREAERKRREAEAAAEAERQRQLQLQAE